MHKPSGLGMVVGTIGFAVLLASSIAHAQIEGALQFPPPSVGEDAQPLPPARMVPPIISPRRVELDISGSSLPPTNHDYRIHPATKMDQRPMKLAPLLDASSIPLASSGGN